MIVGKLRKVGNSYVVTIPRVEMKRLDLREGQQVSLEVRPTLTRELREAYESELALSRPTLRSLAQ